MAAEEGNTYTEYSHEEMKVIMKAFAQHLAEGLSKDCFSLCHDETIDRHLKKYPNVYASEKREIEIGYKKGREYWERQGKEGLWGGKQFNPVVWIFNMKNRYKEHWSDLTKQENDNKNHHDGTFTVDFREVLNTNNENSEE